MKDASAYHSSAAHRRQLSPSLWRTGSTLKLAHSETRYRLHSHGALLCAGRAAALSNSLLAHLLQRLHTAGAFPSACRYRSRAAVWRVAHPRSSGSGQQSVTCFEASDDANSLWTVRAPLGAVRAQGTPVKNGDTLRFQHLATGCALSAQHTFPLILSGGGCTRMPTARRSHTSKRLAATVRASPGALARLTPCWRTRPQATRRRATRRTSGSWRQSRVTASGSEGRRWLCSMSARVSGSPPPRAHIHAQSRVSTRWLVRRGVAPMLSGRLLKASTTPAGPSKASTTPGPSRNRRDRGPLAILC